MANMKARVDIPKSPVDKLELASRVYAKHLAEGEKSLLKGLQSHTWEVNGPKVVETQELHRQAEEYQRLANMAYRQRDLNLEEIDESLKSSRDLLLGVYRDNPKDLGQWGFDVSDAVKAPAKKAE